nr:MAG TPA: hypothetical protein [Caudoviricetes sp.]
MIALFLYKNSKESLGTCKVFPKKLLYIERNL